MDSSKTRICTYCGHQLINLEYSSEDANEGNYTENSETNELVLHDKPNKIQHKANR